MALLQNVLPHQFISEKVKIVEAVYFANILNQSCFECFEYQKAEPLNKPVSSRSLGEHGEHIPMFFQLVSTKET